MSCKLYFVFENSFYKLYEIYKNDSNKKYESICAESRLVSHMTHLHEDELEYMYQDELIGFQK